jgi:hypothetical protein
VRPFFCLFPCQFIIPPLRPLGLWGKYLLFLINKVIENPRDAETQRPRDPEIKKKISRSRSVLIPTYICLIFPLRCNSKLKWISHRDTEGEGELHIKLTKNTKGM